MTRSMRELVLASGILVGLAGCSSSAEDEDDINASNNSENAANESGNNSNNPNKNKNNNFGENVNNSTKNEFVNDQGNMGKVGNAPPPISNSTNALLTNNPSLNSPPPSNVPANIPPASNVAAVPPPINGTTAAAIPVPMGPPVTGYGPDGRGKVKYVRRPTQKFSKPGQTPVGSLDTGDHPLVVKEEGTWNQLSNGTFVDQQELSDEGIGRPRKPRSWQ